MLGVDVWNEPQRAKRLLGVLPDGMALPERLTGRELLTYLGRLRGMDRDTVERRVGELLDALGSPSAEHTVVIDYSAGMRKKITLATALLHSPEVLVLDEPFEAVDPVSVLTIRTILRRFVDAGGSIVMSSHVMPLVEGLCDRVGVLAHGQLVAQGTLDDVRGDGSLDDAFLRLVDGRNLTSGSVVALALADRMGTNAVSSADDAASLGATTGALVAMRRSLAATRRVGAARSRRPSPSARRPRSPPSSSVSCRSRTAIAGSTCKPRSPSRG